jgi:hypothetical protein
MNFPSAYVKILQADRPPRIPPGVLGNYEVALLYLQRFGTFNLGQENFPELNPDAFGVWAQDAESIRLFFNVQELVTRIPERVLGSLDLFGSQIKELPKLEKVGGDLDLSYSQAQKLPRLTEIGGDLLLKHSQIQELPHLVKVGNLIYAEKEKLDRWKDYFCRNGRVYLAEKVTSW